MIRPEPGGGFGVITHLRAVIFGQFIHIIAVSRHVCLVVDYRDSVVMYKQPVDDAVSASVIAGFLTDPDGLPQKTIGVVAGDRVYQVSFGAGVWQREELWTLSFVRDGALVMKLESGVVIVAGGADAAGARADVEVCWPEELPAL